MAKKGLSKKHAATLRRVFAHPLPSNLPWRKVEGLLKGLGATVSEDRSGSRVAITMPTGEVLVHHRAHAQGRDCDKGHIAEIREWLRGLGIEPGDRATKGEKK